ncbi:MAG TPA: thiamine phosphate synthase [Vicinamibacterales bacterium]|jgi:thiamine-phosphate pyrophosphorylase|nr:thiamine phosphate synthase [Vicinamibacterales bacterium]
MTIVDADVARRFGWTMVDLASAFLEGGASLLQLRAKEAPSGWMLETASAIVERSHQAKALVIVNDRADIARLSGADGVHVGQDDLSPAAVRRVLAADALVGLSTHTDEQVEAALLQPVSYIAIGPVFQTGTKSTGYDSRGLEAVQRAAARAGGRGLPLVGIGGVTLETAPDVLRAGASSVAVIGDLMVGRDPAARVREYLKRLTV